MKPGFDVHRCSVVEGKPAVSERHGGTAPLHRDDVRSQAAADGVVFVYMHRRLKHM